MVDMLEGLDLDSLSPEDREGLYKLALSTLAKQDNPEGFKYFYELVFGKAIPDHALSWIETLYAARKEKKRGVVIEAFRGSTKTTTLTIAFTAFRIGHEPHRSNLLIQVGDDIAQDNTAQIADIICNNPGFKLVFPNVEPDRERGWGAGGYEVKRNDMEYTAWRELNAKRKDPTLVGVGYKSREIIGKHPDGILVIDDIHDENNTSSERELETVRKILTGTIFPTMTKETWVVFVGTPWVSSDVLHYVASIGDFLHSKTPVFVANPDGDAELFGEKVTLTWKKRFNAAEIERAKRISGQVEFARMYKLDLTAANNRVFKYYPYPNDKVAWNLPMVAGVDYAGTMNDWINKTGRGDYFAIAYLLKLPGFGAVVVDGVLERVTQAEAESLLKRTQEMFSNLQNMVVEGDGKGEEFIQVVRRNPGIKLIPMKTGGKGKALRLEKQMGPWFENGTIRVSDAETPFLNELRRELDSYPLCDHDDAMDAVYWAMRGMPDVLGMPDAREDIPVGIRKKKTANPFLAFGRA